MFLESLVESSARARTRRGWATLMSFLLETVAIALLILVPLLYTNALPSLNYWVEGPVLLPPRGDPRPNQAATSNRRPQPQSELNEHGGVQLPRRVPPEVWVPKPGEDVRVGPPGGCEYCVPGGVGDGPVNPFILGAMRRVPQPSVDAAPAAPVLLVSRASEAMLLHRVQPIYPDIALRARIEGRVVLHAIIGRDGIIRNLQAESGHPLLVGAALDAVRQWRYRPYYLGGRPVEVETQVIVNFVLSR